MKKMLKVGYIQLADWQKGIGENGIGLDISKMDMDDDHLKLAQQISDQGSDHKKWQSALRAEQEKLQQELVDLGLLVNIFHTGAASPCR